MSSSSVEVEGLARLRRDLRALEGNLDDLKDAHAAAAAVVAAAAAARAPRRSGRLAASARGNRAAGKAEVVLGGAAVPYAGPIHWGWITADPVKGKGRRRNIESNPFAVDAAEATRDVWLGQYEREVQALADRVGGV